MRRPGLPELLEGTSPRPARVLLIQQQQQKSQSIEAPQLHARVTLEA